MFGSGEGEARLCLQEKEEEEEVFNPLVPSVVLAMQFPYLVLTRSRFETR